MDSSRATQGEPANFQHKAGERLGNYLLQRPLGCGGFAEVWEAADSSTNRNVALKIFFDKVVHDPTVWRAIREEPKKQPEHERIVPIYYCQLDSDQSPGPYYVVMKLMPGGTLDELLQRRTKLPAQEAIGIIGDVLSGLEFAHERGIVHRDLKPTNILFDANGRASLADFGIAKDLNKSGNSTVFGSVVGTAAYMSPEQGEGRTVTKATDIYSLGTVLYETLTGKLPFDGPTDTAIIIARSRDNPPALRSTIPELPERLEKVVLNSLDKDLEHRYPDCGSFRRALDWSMLADVKPEKTTPVESPKPASSNAKLIVAGAVLAALVGVFAFWFMHRSNGGTTDDLAQIPWNTVRFDNSHFSNCHGYEPCLRRKVHAEELQSIKWENIRWDSPVLQDCMSYQPCENRRRLAVQLTASKTWVSGQDCMGYLPCQLSKEKKTSLPQSGVVKHSADPKDPEEKSSGGDIFSQDKKHDE